MIATCGKCGYQFHTRQVDGSRCHKDCKSGGRCEFSLTPETNADRVALLSPPLLVSPSPPLASPCVHLGPPTGETIACQSCTGQVKIKLFACAVHGQCSLAKPVGRQCCAGCESYTPAARDS